MSIIPVVTDIQGVVSTGSVLLQCAKTYGPVDDVSDEIDKHVGFWRSQVEDASQEPTDKRVIPRSAAVYNYF